VRRSDPASCAPARNAMHRRFGGTTRSASVPSFNGPTLHDSSGPDGAANVQGRPADPVGKGPEDQLAAASGYRRSASPMRKAAHRFPRQRYETEPRAEVPCAGSRSRGRRQQTVGGVSDSLLPPLKKQLDDVLRRFVARKPFVLGIGVETLQRLRQQCQSDLSRISARPAHVFLRCCFLGLRFLAHDDISSK
jgi:hypothetical protein